jgi:predicted HAD superfamily phosphohydrolase YqeG
MAEENPDFKQRSWFEYQTEASPEELWELLTSKEMGKILSQEYVDNVLHDYDNTFLNWVNQQKADNTVDKFIGARATNNIYDIVEQPDMNKFVDWAIENNQVEPLDFGVYSASGSPNSPAMKAAMAGQFIEQAGRYGVPLSEDVLNEQVKLVDPTLVGKYVAKDDRDQSVLKNQTMLDAASANYIDTMGTDPKIAEANAKAAAAMADQGMYAYDPDADLSNVALREAMLKDANNMQGVYQYYDLLNDSPYYQSLYDETPALFDEFDKLGSYMTDEAYAEAKEQNRKDFENLIATIANNQGYYYQGGK